MQVDFYQLGRDPLPAVLASIATRVLAGGGRLLVVTGDDAQARAIDEGLWTASVESFLPHGLVGADQPILISASPEPANAARNVAIVDGLWREEALGFDRAFHFFDDGSIDAARTAWRGLKGREGVEPRYWRQEEGRWRQVA
ncbi:DNA polymerase III subunit chi [Sphingomonas sp. CGMCC 1.13654]|uniref:DNA polymerase III subunit chi n=1 Tax=Sphingomonas chungangi TaxID=2683589 RepID=A0A838L228_9SPHN|nr:DNA polymerase III subunit chi [Sphingomonas chungangi]MBA2933244.1 DNA polymerase III subunit chi [Sphingomonas chungangi]MVW57914.1 DNA polymerase III subunit chi [Sphingomonas chungangi]